MIRWLMDFDVTSSDVICSGIDMFDRVMNASNIVNFNFFQLKISMITKTGKLKNISDRFLNLKTSLNY